MNSTSGLLEYCKNDAVVVAYEGSFGNVGVHSFIGYTPHTHLKILMPQFNVYDIKFDEVSEDLDILVRPFKFATKVADSSMILHLNQSLVSYGGPLFCHKYMDERLNSLDWIPWEKNCFVASGHDVGGSHLRAYKYYYNNWGNCTQQQILQAVPLEKKDVVSEKLIYDECEVEMLELESYEMATPLTIICE